MLVAGGLYSQPAKPWLEAEFAGYVNSMIDRMRRVTDWDKTDFTEGELAMVDEITRLQKELSERKDA